MYFEHNQMFESSTTVLAADGLVDLGSEIVVNGEADEIALWVLNNNAIAAALTNFTMLVKPHVGATWVTMITGAAWNSVAGMLLAFNTRVDTLAAMGQAALLIKTGPIHSFMFQADSAGDTSVALKGQVRKVS
jgi:hypothetical protein